MSRGSLFRLLDTHSTCKTCQHEQGEVDNPKNGQERPAKQVQQLSINAGFYDHGQPVSLSLPPGLADKPMPVVKRREEYEVVARMFSGNTEDSFYVEPFEEAPNAGQEREEEHSSEVRQERRSQKPQHRTSSGEGPVADDPPTSPEEETIDISNDHFEADLRQILAGKKRYDASTGRAVPTDEARQPSSGNTEPPYMPAPPATEEKKVNEHGIFERIAQSMKLATAYDLGSVALNQRFDSFDKEMEHSKKKVK